MANMHRTASGKAIDMSALSAKNENVRAVGNMSVNAKGDLIDSSNKIITPVSQRVARVYNKTTQNPSAQPQPRASSVTPTPAPTPAPTSKPPVAKEEPPVVFLEDMSDDEVEYFDEFDVEVPEKQDTKAKKK